MRRFKALLLAVLVFCLPATALAVEIAAQQTAPDRYRLTVAVNSAEQARQLQEALSQRAALLCEAKPFWFGRYSFSASKQITGQPKSQAPMTFAQDMGCGEQAAPLFRQAEPAFDAVTGDDRAVIEATKMWFFQAEGGDYVAAYRAMSAELGAPPFADWQRTTADNVAKSGKRLLHNVFKITWYQDPPGAPPGVYAAADFENRFEAVAARCGYLIWHKAPGADGFVITRIQEGIIDRATADGMTTADLDAARAEMRCPPRPRS